MAKPPATAASSRQRLLDAALHEFRSRGYAATTVDDLCRAAGVGKGSFFHHFASKEALGVALIDDWTQMTGAMFAAHPYHALPDPLDRVFGYIDLRRALLGQPVLVAEMTGTHSCDEGDARAYWMVTLGEVPAPEGPVTTCAELTVSVRPGAVVLEADPGSQGGEAWSWTPDEGWASAG